ncbi:D-arabinono-1,4-lactone oxidase [Solwaraspora sp. WMMD406]|uniref:D-arabinono-1,4-lactone oxidase n=1 Tax=Solwaraspora sp. WMMD406 TaxID=3016095 RepID=UPI002416919E|nr:D-arabinono-1,4-lactone oxidase [Solwaraspora sp. WMMD406]MDG4766046.1 D-arabinono-1,4-lactone oxidase [Solwaraspora sp. WMMD406]
MSRDDTPPAPTPPTGTGPGSLGTAAAAGPGPAPRSGPAVATVEVPPSWRNWSGGLCFQPAGIARPDSVDQLCRIVRQTAARGGCVRPVGAGHSSAPLVRTDDLLLSVDRLPSGVLGTPADGQAWVGAGTRLHELGDLLRRHGLAMPNLGDVDTQAIAGAIGTGTHGSGRGLSNLSAMVTGVRLVTAAGQVIEIDGEREPDVLRAVQLSLGVLGVLTAVRTRVVPAFQARRREWGLPTDECLAVFDALLDANRNVDFYWYPRRDDAHLRTVNPVDDDPGPARLPATDCTEDRVGWSGSALTKRRSLRFHEIEYAVPAAAGPACFQELRHRIRIRHRQHAAWRVLYRYVAADHAYLSPAYGRDSVTISVHQNETSPYQEFFADVEPIFHAYGGRPHWAKIHHLEGRDLLSRYPEADRFLTVRHRLDPDGVFLSDYLRRLLAL